MCMEQLSPSGNMTEAAVARESAVAVELPGCPILDRESRTRYNEAKRSAVGLSVRIGEFLGRFDADTQAAWLKASLSRSRELFQPWTMEILYLGAVRGTVRFSDLEAMLGISSRTLSNKLKTLTEAGFLDRNVYNEHPVRIEYTLTKHGKTTAALMAPIFTHLNMQATGQA